MTWPAENPAGPEQQGSKSVGRQIVGPLAAARVHFCRSRVNQIAVRVKGAQQTGFVKLHAGLNSFQSIFTYEERAFHGGVIPPKSNRSPRSVIRAAEIGKTH